MKYIFSDLSNVCTISDWNRDLKYETFVCFLGLSAKMQQASSIHSFRLKEETSCPIRLKKILVIF